MIFNYCRAGSQNLVFKFLFLSGTGLVHAEVPELVQQLLKFPALQQLDVSNNLGLDRVAVSHIAQGLSGNSSFSCVFVVTSFCVHIFVAVVIDTQEHEISWSSISAALVLKACPTTLCNAFLNSVICI